MNYIDVIIAISLIWFAYKGFTKGLIIEVTSLIALILGIYISYHFSGFAADLLAKNFNINGKYLPLISFTVTFIAVVILVYFIGKVLERIVNLVMLGFVNKLLGAIFGILKIGLIISTFLLIINSIQIDLIPEKSKENSILYKPVEKLAPFVLPKLKELKDSLI
ncbi:CvpA family protein [Bacteroidota bacterium]